MKLKSSRHRQSDGVICELNYFLVWCIKSRKPLMRDQTIRDRLEALIKAAAMSIDAKVSGFEITEDGIGFMLSAGSVRSVAEMVVGLKNFTAPRLRDEFPDLQKKLPNLWNRDYFAVTMPCGDFSKRLGLFLESQKPQQRGI